MGSFFEQDVFGSSYLDVWDGNPEHEAYEEAVLHRIEEEFDARFYTIRSRRLFEFEDGTEICPDVVVVLKHDHSEEYACVVDAKYRERLERRHVLKIVQYKERLAASDARLYVPTECHIQRGAAALAIAHAIRIVTDLEW